MTSRAKAGLIIRKSPHRQRCGGGSWRASPSGFGYKFVDPLVCERWADLWSIRHTAESYCLNFSSFFHKGWTRKGFRCCFRRAASPNCSSQKAVLPSVHNSCAPRCDRSVRMHLTRGIILEKFQQSLTRELLLGQELHHQITSIVRQKKPQTHS